MAIADTGDSDHYFTASAPVANINPSAPRITIRTAAGAPHTSSASAQLALDTLPSSQASTGHIVPGFTHSLLSIGKLCDAGCTATFTQQSLTVTNAHGLPILLGSRAPHGPRLWTIDISPHLARALHATSTGLPPSSAPALILPDADDVPGPSPAPPPLVAPLHTLASPVPSSLPHIRAYDLPNTPALVVYLHATAGYPVKSTWLTAIKLGYYSSWPGLTYTLAAKYCPDADETHFGHMAQPRQHVRST